MKENRSKPLLTIIYCENQDVITKSGDPSKESDEDIGEWTNP